MFNVRLKPPALLKNVLDTVKDLLTEAIFEFSELGIRIQMIDNAHVSVISLTLESDSFDEYWCDGGRRLGMNIRCLSKVLQRTDAGDIVDLRAHSESVEVVFLSSKKEEEIKYEMELINIDYIPQNMYLNQNIYDISYSYIVKMPTAEFIHICRDLSQLGESITFACSKGSIKFSASGDNTSANIQVEQTADADNEEKSVVIQMEDYQSPMKFTFPCRYLNNFPKIDLLCNQIQLSISDKVPLVCEYKMTHVKKSKKRNIGSIKYYLLPKIYDEEKNNDVEIRYSYATNL
ncbi:proliferating cell nuclear antigen [Monomorium pharaonis]|uniref:proliferating cell nuclear antigen n=1 Tax=Monomorium pharaonis TaxID=307658 RepID=UPI001745EEB1|nr:proliferating cell nuclear antigen [Monomorium pharaonis]